MKKIIFVFWSLFSGYVLVTEYQYYRDSTVTTGVVSAIRYTSSGERRTSDTCTSFRGRTDCSALYEYDITWWEGNKSYIYHVEKEHTPPSKTICMNIVQGRPGIGKPCNSFFFNTSWVPFLIATWFIIAFISFTLLVHRKLHPELSKRPARTLYRVYNKKRHLVLETLDQQEALTFISNGYRISATVRHREIVGSGCKRSVIDCVTYFVRVRKGAERR